MNTLIGIGAIIAIIIAAMFKSRSDGKASATAEIKAEAAQEQLEMHREASEIERRVGDLNDDEVKKRLIAAMKKKQK